MDPTAIKQEPAEGPEGLLPEIKIPEGFERSEWVALTEVVITVFNHSIILIWVGFCF